MQSRLNPYLSFRDNAREAMEFYHTDRWRAADEHVQGVRRVPRPSEADKIMHSMLEADNGMTFMAADTPNAMEYKPGTNYSVSLSGDNDEELSGYYEKLSAGGTEIMPLEKAPWGDKFGMVTDKFAVQWMVNISDQSA